MEVQTFLNEEQVEKLKKDHGLSIEQIFEFHAQFLALDTDKSGSITIGELAFAQKVSTYLLNSVNEVKT